mgnify:CR=1 FL=1
MMFQLERIIMRNKLIIFKNMFIYHNLILGILEIIEFVMCMKSIK